MVKNRPTALAERNCKGKLRVKSICARAYNKDPLKNEHIFNTTLNVTSLLSLVSFD